MSRDDYISKLFIKNQDKLEQLPSKDLWSKMEWQLDQDLPVTQGSIFGATSRTKVIGRSKYLVAASILVVLASTVYLFQLMESSSMDQTVFIEPLAIYTDVLDMEEEGYDSDKKLPTNLEAKKVTEEVEQAAKIVAAVNEKVLQENIVISNATTKKIALERIKIIDEKEVDDIILIELELPQETNTTGTAESSPTTTRENLYKNDAIAEHNGLNYNRNYVPQIANSLDNNSVVQEVLNQSKDKGGVGNIPKLKSDLRKRSTGRGKIIGKEKKAVKKIKYPMAAAHPRLYPLGFLLGKWEDSNEMEGKSYEIWTLKSSNVLIGKGYKLSNNAERIFEEVLRIEFRDNQIFLVISLDENKKTVDYMLTTFDNERFTFEQQGAKNYPNKVIIQQSGLDAYSVMIVNNYNFLTTDQQRYLENRNRVSNVQSMRTMQYKD